MFTGFAVADGRWAVDGGRCWIQAPGGSNYRLQGYHLFGGYRTAAYWRGLAACRWERSPLEAMAVGLALAKTAVGLAINLRPLGSATTGCWGQAAVCEVMERRCFRGQRCCLTVAVGRPRRLRGVASKSDCRGCPQAKPAGSAAFESLLTALLHTNSTK